MAEQQQPIHRHVALKVIKLGMDTQSVITRFEAERQALALMDHPNIAKVLDAGATETGRPYFVMELVHGTRITDFCDRNRLATRERLQLFTQVCRAVQHAHQKGIIHRDLKPSNVLVTRHDDVPVPKVIDFGIAKATQGRLSDQTLFTAFEQFLGTPAYMSPEQAELSGLDIDTRSDIYSLGVLLYELLTGETPLDTKELLQAGFDEMRQTIRTREPARPSTRLKTMLQGELETTAQQRQTEAPKLILQVRGDLDWIVMKCLEKDRARRYETANGLARDLERQLNNEPVLARPPSAVDKLQKFVRRNKVLVAAGMLVASLLVVGILLSAWGLRKLLQANARARQNLYAAQMREARTDWENNDIEHLRQLLKDTQEFSGRGFEWFYWERQTHSELSTFYGHLSPVYKVAISPDGERVATATQYESTKVFEAKTGRELLTLLPPTAPVAALAYSADGRQIVTGGYDRTVRLWDSATGRCLWMVSTPSALESVAVSPDGRKVAGGASDGNLLIWDAETGRLLLQTPTSGNEVFAMTFSPDGCWLLAGSNNEARLWDAETLRPEPLVLRGHTDTIWSVAFSPDARRIVTASDDNTARIWDAQSGRPLLELRGHGRPLVAYPPGVHGAVFALGGRQVATAGMDGTVKLWDAVSGRELRTLKGHILPIACLGICSDGGRIATAGWDKTAKVWDLLTEPESVTLDGSPKACGALAISPDGLQVAAAYADHSVRLSDVQTGHCLYMLTNHTASIRAVTFSPDGQRIVTGGEDCIAVIWDTRSGREILRLTGHKGWVRSAGFSRDGRWIITGSNDGTAKLWDAATGQEVRTLVPLDHDHTSGVGAVAFSPDGTRVLTGSDDDTADVYEASGGRYLFSLLHGSNTTGEKGRHYLFAVNWHRPAGVSLVRFFPDGSRLLVAGEDGTAEVWDARTRTAQPLFSFKAQAAPIRSVALSGDAQRILIGSDDGTARVFEASSGSELLTLTGHSKAVLAALFTTGDRQITTGGADNTLRFWWSASPQEVVHWREQESDGQQHWSSLARARELDRLARADDEGAIRHWLVLDPISVAKVGETVTFMEAEALMNVRLDQQQMPEEARLKPEAGEKVVMPDGTKLFWREVHLTDYALNFNELLGLRGTDKRGDVAAYAVCYIHSEKPLSSLRLKMGADDQAKVYLNGTLVLEKRFNYCYVIDGQEAASVNLNAGTNVLIFKVVNWHSRWLGSIRLTASDGSAIKGIKASVVP
jgi:WD40 repeat protein